MKKRLLFPTIFLMLAMGLGSNALSAAGEGDAWAELLAADGSGEKFLWVYASLAGALPPTGLYLHRVELKDNQLRVWGVAEDKGKLSGFASNLRSLNWVAGAEMAANGTPNHSLQGSMTGSFRFEITVQIQLPGSSSTEDPSEPVLADVPRSLVTTAELDKVAADLNQASLANSLRLELFLVQGKEHREYSVVQPYLLQLVGQFGDVIEFLDQITKLPRLVAMSCSNFEAVSSEIKVNCRAEVHMRRVDNQPVGGRPIRKRDASTRSVIEAAKARSSNPFYAARVVALCPRNTSDGAALNSTIAEATEGQSVLAIINRPDGRHALVKEQSPLLRTLKVGDNFGSNGGRIADIGKDEIVIAERCRSADGLLLDRRIRLPVKK